VGKETADGDFDACGSVIEYGFSVMLVFPLIYGISNDDRGVTRIDVPDCIHMVHL